MSTRVLVDGEPISVTVTRSGASITARIGDAEYHGTTRHDGDTWRLELGDETHSAIVVRDRHEVWVALKGEIYRCTPETEERDTTGAGATRTPRVTAPMPGKVLDVLVQEGQRVAAGDGLVVLEAMKMENVATADAPGTVARVHVVPGTMVEPGQTLIELNLD